MIEKKKMKDGRKIREEQMKEKRREEQMEEREEYRKKEIISNIVGLSCDGIS